MHCASSAGAQPTSEARDGHRHVISFGQSAPSRRNTWIDRPSCWRRRAERTHRSGTCPLRPTLPKPITHCGREALAVSQVRRECRAGIWAAVLHSESSRGVGRRSMACERPRWPFSPHDGVARLQHRVRANRGGAGVRERDEPRQNASAMLAGCGYRLSVGADRGDHGGSDAASMPRHSRKPGGLQQGLHCLAASHGDLCTLREFRRSPHCCEYRRC